MSTRVSSQDYPLGDGPVIIVPAGRFVVRRIPLALGSVVAEQVELAVESFAPLPLDQLFWGYLADLARQSALVWVACRRHFGPEELNLWRKASAVLPAQLLLARAPANGSPFLIHRDGSQVQGAGWLEFDPLPAVLLARSMAPGDEVAGETQLQRELQGRIGATGSGPACVIGPIKVHPLPKRSGIALHAGDFSVRYSWPELASADLREPAELAARRREINRDRWFWRATKSAAVLVLFAAVLDLAWLAAGFGLGRLEARVRERTSTVASVQEAHALAHRLDQLARQQSHFLEMLDVLNGPRPPGLAFTRVASSGPSGLEIAAQTANADDIRQFESALRAASEIQSFSVDNLRTRDGRIDFTLRAEFHAGAFPADPAMP